MNSEEWGDLFWRWVDDLGRWYFNHEMAQRQVRLHWPVADQFIGREEDFLLVLRQWAPLRNPIDVACELSRRWFPKSGEVTASWALPTLPSEHKCMFPPYIPYLVAFAMAWETEGDYASNNYYSRLNEILGQPSSPIGSIEFQHADVLWHELEYWTNKIMGGELGLFTAASLGAMVHVGYPLSQIVLSPMERNRLEWIFAQESLTPDMALEDGDILQLLSRYGAQFSNRVQESLENVGSRFVKALLEEVRIELANSEPIRTPVGRGNDQNQSCPRVQRVNLRLACKMGLHSVDRWFFTVSSDQDDLDDASSENYAFRPGQLGGVLWQRSDEGVYTPDPLEFSNFSPLGMAISINEADDITLVSWPAHQERFFAPLNGVAGLYIEQDFVPDTGPVVVLCTRGEAVLLQGLADAKVPGSIWNDVEFHRFDAVEKLKDLFQKRRSYARRISPIQCIGGVRCNPYEKNVYFPFALPRATASSGWTLSSRHASSSLMPLGDDHIFNIDIDILHPPSQITLDGKREGGGSRTLTLHVDANPQMVIVNVSDSDVTETATHQNEPDPDDIPLWEADLGKQEPLLSLATGSRVLTILSIWGQCSYRKLSDALQELLPSDHNYASRIARGMETLGHVTIENDATTGQWRRLHIKSGILRRLPWDLDFSGDRVAQAVIEGQCNWTLLDGLLHDLPSDVDFDITPQPVPYLPPRVRLFTTQARSLETAAKHLGLEYQTLSTPVTFGDPPASEWKGFQWHQGMLSPSENVSYFSPFLLRDVKATKERFDRLCMLSGGYLLATQKQSYGVGHYYLCDVDGNQRALLPQGERQRARWRCYIAAATEFLAKVQGHYGSAPRTGNLRRDLCMPYVPSFGQILLPYYLLPPTTVARLLVGCTGLLPTIISGGAASDAVCSLDTSTIESHVSPFVVPKGSSLAVFNNVPRAIATQAFNALGIAMHEL